MEWWQRCGGSNEGGHENGGRGGRRPSERWGCRSIPLRHGQSRSYTTNPSTSLFLSLRFALSRAPSLPSRSLCHPATLPPCLCLSSSLSLFLSRLLTPYVRTIANGLQPLPGIYPQNLPERPSNSAASSLAFTLIPPIPQDPSRGSTDCALFKQRDTFPSTTSQFSPGRSPICLAFPG